MDESIRVGGEELIIISNRLDKEEEIYLSWMEGTAHKE